MNDPHNEIQSEPTLLAAEPQLFVADVKASCEFYTKKLGFMVAFTYGEPPFYGQVFRDGARLNLRHLDEPAIRPELQDREHLLSASITVDNAKSLFLEFQAASVIFHQGLKTEPWGLAPSSFVIPTATSYFLQRKDDNPIQLADAAVTFGIKQWSLCMRVNSSRCLG